MADSLQLGWVYKDKRGMDVLIIRKSANTNPNTRALFSTETLCFEGATMGKERAKTYFYTPTGLFDVNDDDEWAKDLVLETGKPWVPAESEPVNVEAEPVTAEAAV